MYVKGELDKGDFKLKHLFCYKIIMKRQLEYSVYFLCRQPNLMDQVVTSKPQFPFYWKFKKKKKNKIEHVLRYSFPKAMATG